MIEQMFSEAEYQVLMVALTSLQITGRDARLLVSTMDKVQECLNMFEQARRTVETEKQEQLQQVLRHEAKKKQV
jgi:hypothetical protein